MRVNRRILGGKSMKETNSFFRRIPELAAALSTGRGNLPKHEAYRESSRPEKKRGFC